MRKALFLFWSFVLISFQIQGQTTFSLKLYSGSNASWGQNQFLSIDYKGHCYYALSDVNKGIKDSSSFKISTSQLNKLNETITKIQFFKLNKTYNEQSRDGTRLSVEIISGGKDQVVHWVNFHNKDSDLLLTTINAILKSKNISISY